GEQLLIGFKLVKRHPAFVHAVGVTVRAILFQDWLHARAEIRPRRNFGGPGGPATQNQPKDDPCRAIGAGLLHRWVMTQIHNSTPYPNLSSSGKPFLAIQRQKIA